MISNKVKSLFLLLNILYYYKLFKDLANITLKNMK